MGSKPCPQCCVSVLSVLVCVGEYKELVPSTPFPLHLWRRYVSFSLPEFLGVMCPADSVIALIPHSGGAASIKEYFLDVSELPALWGS